MRGSPGVVYIPFFILVVFYIFTFIYPFGAFLDNIFARTISQYPNATELRIGSEFYFNEYRGTSIRFKTTDSPEKVTKYYKADFRKRGWKLIYENKKKHVLSYTKNLGLYKLNADVSMSEHDVEIELHYIMWIWLGR